MAAYQSIQLYQLVMKIQRNILGKKAKTVLYVLGGIVLMGVSIWAIIYFMNN